MDLALAIGRDVGSMSERQFVKWGIYSRRKAFPLRRLEYLMALMILKIDRHMGGVKNTTIHDYLFDPARDENGIMVDPKETVIINENDLD